MTGQKTFHGPEDAADGAGREGVAPKSGRLFSQRGSEPEIWSSLLASSRSPGGHSRVSAEKSNQLRT